MVFPCVISGLYGKNGTTYHTWTKVLETRINKGAERGLRKSFSYVSLPNKGNRSRFLLGLLVDEWLVRGLVDD